MHKKQFFLTQNQIIVLTEMKRKQNKKREDLLIWYIQNLKIELL